MKSGDLTVKLIKEIESLPMMSTAPMRKICKEYSKKLRDKDTHYVMEVAHSIINSGNHQWIAYEIIHDHKEAFSSLDRKSLEALGSGIDSWWTVDSFSRILSGPAWRDGQISIDTIRDWAKSADRWWRRAALVSTVALNIRSHGGREDVRNTLSICNILIEDHNNMVVKALSWALRVLIVHDPEEVDKFICIHEEVLAARIKREVRNKLATGLKNP